MKKIDTIVSVDKVRANIAGVIDHTLLKADATLADLDKLCDEAIKYSFAAVCVNPANVAYCVEKLGKSKIPVAAVIGFPLGANHISSKMIEAEFCVDDGATELDMVINIGMLKSGMEEYVFQDIQAVVEAAKGNIVKVIIETSLLTDEEKIKACKLAEKAGALDEVLNRGLARSGKFLGRRISPEQLGRHLVDLLVGALRR